MANFAVVGPMLSWLWVQAWLTLPWLAPELSLPAPVSHLYVWSRVWAVILMPAAMSLLALTAAFGGPRKTRSVGVLMAGWALDTLYWWHHIPTAAQGPVVEQWLTALLALTTLTLASRAEPENTAPALQITSGLVLVLAFAAPAPWALVAGMAVMTAGGTWAVKHLRTQSPNR